MSVLTPLSHALAAVVATAHAGLTSLGADPGVGHHLAAEHRGRCGRRTTRVAAAGLPRRTRRSCLRARPPAPPGAHRALPVHPRSAGAARFTEERRRIAAEHRVPRGGGLVLLVQVPIWLALYHLMATVAAGTSVGALNAGLVASLGAATLLGVPLAQRGYLGGGWTQLAVVAGLVVTAARCPTSPRGSWWHPTTSPTACPETMARVQQLLPTGLGRRPGRGRRRRTGGPARLLGVQRGVDARPVGGGLAVVPHAGFARRRALAAVTVTPVEVKVARPG